MIFSVVSQSFLLLFLFAKDRDDGKKELFKRQRWKASDIVLSLLLTETYPLYFVAVAYLFLQFNVDLRPFIHSLSSRDIDCCASLAALFLLLLLFKFKFKQGISILGYGTDSVKKECGIGFLVGLGAFLMIDGSYLFILHKQFEERIVEMITTVRTPMDYFILLLGTAFLGPIVEEVVYRGILYSPFRKKYGPVMAIIITSLFFGVVHPGLPIAFLVGVFLTTLYEKRQSIISTFVAHSAYNVLVISIAFYMLK